MAALLLNATGKSNNQEVMTRDRLLRIAILTSSIGCVSLLHYETSTHHLWLHQLFQRAYYVPVLLAALWFGWRGGFLAAALAGLLYAPHILTSWASLPAYSVTQYVEIVMFFVVGCLTGILADRERRERATVQETAEKLSQVLAELQASFEQLRRADRLSALGQLSAGLAHEVRNPLGSIQGAIQILRRKDLPDSTREEFSDLAQKEVDRLKGLLSNFLAFARPPAPRRAPTEFMALFESVRQLTAETAAMAGVKIRIEPADALPSVRVDAEQMKQVLLNLVINAIEAMPGGGEIVLSAESQRDFVVARVRDEGRGIAPENVEKIFDPFFTTRPDGTGLGLSIAYQIVSQHFGHLEVQSNPDRGMTFAVYLPLLDEKAVELKYAAKAG